ncbi:SDR family oxidoreductase [Paenibacillus sp. FSL R7-0048]|jgi:NAD(P)-dependent dehydrogenase (short-subunit alcohol dehydrogenase family)|uniref:Short-chain dehydrogenase n=1 Tax=Paenibacillus odorifer TaxID=189426 RepID=A0A1R0YYS3_9BACL|nr:MULTISPECIES: SDR family oxidoreductase [Paenibacillus]AWV34919.1 short-chain dehydrogenase [Paenibacillus odorifer]MDH6429648.1 NAD(P)-dependent dehydrogenase (short-subunit alcohol dehydrogenase family) [Paenibacillus sp. PastH-4]MDH6446254.1 NAD(P)-dependent dehydrogenase (short-subunit alcohol dehydrogenase family) [Paenibacillus sp. PastF-4]MDH6530278.1 NAD(P)-dependent dehydrogenase (short-subunit alcohol dehydrogenase family) [Paenibacillus sp. PastH-3]OMC73283.1 short-chain dehydrog
MTDKRVAVITGGASGIGKQTAIKFASKGDQVVVADFNQQLGEETVAQIIKEGGEAIFVKTDVSKYEDVEALVQKTVDTYGRIDVMFNNAGIGRVTPVLDQDLKDYHSVINVNQHGVAHGIIAAGKKMRELGIKGVIINTASVFGFLASPGTFAYHASKGAVIMMTKSAALELSVHGIRVLAVAPGAVDTPIIQGYKDQGMVDQMKSKVMGNKLTLPEQVADTVYLLSLPEASAINGSVVMADEGYASFK